MEEQHNKKDQLCTYIHLNWNGVPPVLSTALRMFIQVNEKDLPQLILDQEDHCANGLTARILMRLMALFNEQLEEVKQNKRQLKK